MEVKVNRENLCIEVKMDFCFNPFVESCYDSLKYNVNEYLDNEEDYADEDERFNEDVKSKLREFADYDLSKFEMGDVLQKIVDKLEYQEDIVLLIDEWEDYRYSVDEAVVEWVADRFDIDEDVLKKINEYFN